MSSEFLAFMGLGLTLILSSTTAAWVLLNKIADVANKIYLKIDQTQRLLIDKLEYHEKHDDVRFANISNDLWALRVRNAARDGDLVEAKRLPEAFNG